MPTGRLTGRAAGAAALVLAVAGAVAAATRVTRLEISGSSMQPTLGPGDRVLAWRTRRVRPGCVVAVRDPRLPERVMVKRVRRRVGGAVLVDGDNPAFSTDSRTFGAVDRILIVGRVFYRYHPSARAGRITRRRVPSMPMPVEPADIERFLDPSFLDGLEERPIEDVRSSRAEIQRAELALSYVRRLVQGRLDILEAERRGRESGTEVADDPVHLLPEILADAPRQSGPGRLPMQIDPGEEAAILVADLDRAVDPGTLTDLAGQSLSDLDAAAEKLREVERGISDQRHVLHERLGTLEAELVRRYRSGEASVDALLK